MSRLESFRLPGTAAPTARALASVVMGLLVAVPATSWPTTVRTFPGCGATVQSCIDASAPGDTVEIATATPIAENLTLLTGLTLRPAAGVTATVVGIVAARSHGSAVRTFRVEGLAAVPPRRSRISRTVPSTRRGSRTSPDFSACSWTTR